jgi:phosphoenolpyruvate-protein kinase (PTS system EI component)
MNFDESPETEIMIEVLSVAMLVDSISKEVDLFQYE